MQKVIFSSIFSTERETRQVNVRPPKQVPHLVVEKTGIGNGESHPVTPAGPGKYFGTYNSINQLKSRTERGFSLPTIMR